MLAGWTVLAGFADLFSGGNRSQDDVVRLQGAIAFATAAILLVLSLFAAGFVHSLPKRPKA